MIAAGTPRILDVVSANWWAWLIRGICAIIFGVLAFMWPVAAILAFGILFGAYALVDGVFAIVAAIRTAEQHGRWLPLLIEGLAGLLIAGFAFWDLRVVLLAMYLVIAAWAFVTGVFEIVAAIELRKHISNEIWLIVGGIASIVFSILLFLHPLLGAIVITWLVGAYAVLFGILMIAFAFRVRGLKAAAGTA